MNFKKNAEPSISSIRNMSYALLSLGLSVFLLGCMANNPPQTVDTVDVERYMGVWYEIAKFPVVFQRGLVGITAEYILEEDGRIRVINRGLKGAFDGEESSIKGYATTPNPEEPAKLRVRFDPFPVSLFPGDYWIVELDEEYAYAVVSGPSRNMLWILSRTPSMAESQYEGIIQGLEERGFDMTKIQRTPQLDSEANTG